MPNYGYTEGTDFRRKSQKVFVDRSTNDVILRLHETDIVRVRPNGDVILCTGGWATHKTLHSMNDALQLFDMWVESTGSIPRGDWVVYDSDGTTIPYKNDKTNFIITIPGTASEARQRAKWLAEAYDVDYNPNRGQQQAAPRVVSAPPPPRQQAAHVGAVVAAATAAATAGPQPAAAAVNGTAANAALASRQSPASSWANIAKSGSHVGAPAAPAGGAAPAAAATAAARHARGLFTGGGPRVTGPGGASSSAAAPAAAPAGPTTTSSAASPSSQGGLWALDIARTKLQANKTSASRPVEEQLEEHMKKLGIQAEELEDDTHTCVVCMDNPRVTVLVPCGHMALCRACCKMLIEDKKSNGDEAQCPMCCQAVDYHVEVDS